MDYYSTTHTFHCNNCGEAYIFVKGKFMRINTDQEPKHIGWILLIIALISIFIFIVSVAKGLIIINAPWRP